jgi:hypothetical protein
MQSLFEEDIEQDNIPKKKPKTFTNCLAENFSMIIFERKISLSKVQKDTSIPFPTLHDWVRGKTIPLADDNLMVLSKYLEISLEYLCFGVGSESKEDSLEIDFGVTNLAEHFKCEKELILKVIQGE